MIMKYIISESKLDGLIYDYIDKLFSERQLNYGHPLMYNDLGDEVENKNAYEFFFETGSSDEDVCFKWVDCGYFLNPSPMSSLCPILIVENQFEWRLNSLFQDLWKPIFRKWFIDKFNLPVTTIRE